MVSNDTESLEETLVEIEFNGDIIATKPHEYIQLRIQSTETSSSDERLCRRRRFLDFLKSSVSGVISFFRQAVSEREEISVSVPSGVSFRQRFHHRFIRRINLGFLVNIFKDWIKHPMNVALLVWLICVAVSAVMLALLLLGLLNKAFPTKPARNRWIEINNQVLNALFTLMSLYQHPNLFHHLVLLCRWRSEDIVELRKIYCKDGAYRHHEWAHMMLVVLLLHVTCFAQYVSCGLYWGYSSKLRPQFVEHLSFALGTVAPIVAGLYTVYSPLGRELSPGTEEELQEIQASNKNARALSNPEWRGGLFDCGNDKTAGVLSFFCMFCIFGWNMERLGFGNMYVHMVTFFLLCVAPFWIFSISALNISNDVIRGVVGVSGLVLCVFGLVYGGFWRIQMRKKFGLPGNSFCCGSDSMTDYVQWMLCWACSLAQEVRTVNSYDVEDDSFHNKYGDSDGNCDGQADKYLVVEQSDSAMVMIPPMQASIQSECRDTDGNSSASPSGSRTERRVVDSNQDAETRKFVEIL